MVNIRLSNPRVLKSTDHLSTANWRAKRSVFHIFSCFSIKVVISLSLLFTIIMSLSLLSPMVSQKNFYSAPASGKKDEFLTAYADTLYHIIFRHSWRQSCSFLWAMSVFHCCSCSNALSKVSAHRSITEIVLKPFLASDQWALKLHFLLHWAESWWQVEI